MRKAAVIAAAAVLLADFGELSRAAAAGAEEKAPKGTHRAEVAGVEAVDFVGNTRVRLRAEGAGDRSVVDILVGPAEGAAIYRGLSGQRMPRPMTHDLLAAVVAELGGKITRLTVTRLEETAGGGGVFIGELVVTRDGEEHVFDTRPSDGMALAVAAGVPIYVAEEVLETAGRPEESKDGEKDEQAEQQKEDAPPLPPRPFGPPRDLI